MIALLAPGQGSQTPGMLADWLELPGAADQISRWSQISGLDLATLGTTATAEQITDTAVTQPLVVATTLLAGSEACGGVFARLVWKRTMGLDIRLGAPHTVAGWVVDADRYDQFVLACAGRRTSGLMVFDPTSSTISWTTALVFHTPMGALLWRGLGPAHRALVPRQLKRLAARGA